MSKKKKDNINALWRTYTVSPYARTQIFNKMQIIKLTYYDICNHLNISYLVQNGYIQEYFFMHDYYELEGKKLPIFKNFIETIKNQNADDQQDQKTIKTAEIDLLFYKNMKISCKRLQSAKKQIKWQENKKNQIKEQFQNDKSSLYLAKLNEQELNNKLKNLKCKWKCNIISPWNIPLEQIRFYFGEKIALYYKFLTYYCRKLLAIGFIGLFVFLFEQVVDSDHFSSIIIYIVFSCLIQFWSSYIIYEWERKEKIFCLQIGYSQEKQTEPDRPQFKGVYRRSLASDDINSLWSSSWSKGINYFYYAISYIFLIAINIVSSILLINQIENLEEKVGTLDFIQPGVLIIASANYFILVILSKIQEFIATKLTNNENHQKVSSYEQSFIIKIYLFQSINFAMPLFLIAFLNVAYPDDFDCAGYQCFELLKLYTRSFFYIIFLSNFFEIVIPAIKYKLKKSLNYEDDDNKNNEEKNKKADIFYEINQKIEKESYKEEYNENEDIDGTISDYIELLVNFSFLTFFGVVFPLLFSASYFLMVLEIQVDKMKMMNYLRRPFPKNAGDIGIWKVLMEFASLLGILINSLIITYTNDNMGDFDNRFIYFLLMLILSYGIKFIMFLLYQRLPQNLSDCSSRLKRLSMKSISSTGRSSLKNIMKPQFPIFKIWGARIKKRTKSNLETQED